MEPQCEVIIDSTQQQPKLTASVAQISRLLQTIEDDILPKTKEGVSNGNKVFGAALLNKDWNLTLAATNDEMNNPLFHGEIKLINDWSKMTKAGDRGRAAQESIFLSTHEPCCMCIRCEHLSSEIFTPINRTDIY
jgi:tRNA(Arg) A34 adenosine deaminase TadA